MRKEHIKIAETLHSGVHLIYDLKTGKRRTMGKYENNQLGGYRYAIDTLIALFEQESPGFDAKQFLEIILPLPEKD